MMAHKEQSHFDRITNTHGKYICGAPWTSFSLEADSEIAFCCAANDKIRDIRQGATSLDEIINSPKAKAVRADLLKGNKPEYCSYCWRSEEMDNVPAPNRQYCTKESHSTIDELIKHTDSDGYMHKQAPTWFDVMFSNKCNFACMGCWTHLSTAIGKYAEAYDTRDRYDIGLPPYQPLRQSLSEKELLISGVDIDAMIDHVIKHQDTMTHIHLVGGEPFMMPEVYETLDKLIQHDLHKPDGIGIWCHTNGSIRTYKGEDIVEKYLSKWEDRFHITMSHDGFGPRGEYIRYGYKDKKWLEIQKRLLDAGSQINIHHCLNIFNILHQKECLHWYIDNLSMDYDSTGHLSSRWLNFGYWDGLFSLSHIKNVPQLYDHAINDIHACLDICDQDPNLSHQKEEYEKILSRVENVVMDTLPLHPHFVKAINKFDGMRQTDFHKTFPELKPLWDYNDQMR